MTVLSRFVAVCAILLVALPAMAQRPNPTPSGTKGTTQPGGQQGGPGTQTTGEIRQWASAAIASSEYSSTDWSALQATGAPNSSGCRDQGTAFATRTAGNGEYLIVGFDQYVIPTQINVYIVLNPGSITKLSVANSADPESIVDVTNSGDRGSTTCPGVHSVTITNATMAVDSVIISLDQAASGTWTEIDAVELVGYAPGTTPPTTTGPSGPTGPTGPTGPGGTTPQQRFDTMPGIAVTCPGGISFNNGVEVVVNMRPGFNYTATAIGVGTFDPIIAVIDENGNTLCNDDDPAASRYIAYLPTTGAIGPSSFTAHKPFSYSGSTLGNVSLVVGSVGSTAGEFVLLIEGLAVTRNDGSGEAAGDPFIVNVSQNVIASEVPVTAYMISVTNALDSMITTLDLNGERIIRLDDGTPVSCDDAGSASLCFGDSVNMKDYYVSRQNGRTLPGGNYDAMLSIPSTIFDIDEGGLLNFRFTSSGQATLGDYVAAFHLGTTASGR